MTEHVLEHPMRAALFTDLYELTMAQAYQAEGMTETAVFELFFREMPETRSFVMTAGVREVLDYVENWHFTERDIAYLEKQGQFSESFLGRLGRLRFTGDIWAMPEGTPVFENEPIVQVVAPVVEAQILETFILNQVHFQSIAATKSARVVMAAKGRNVVDFGSRRAHGLDAALSVARVCYLVGGAGTSNLQAGKLYGVPTFGTMAHSYIQAHESESETFEAFARLYPNTTLLVDTYDTLNGVRKVVELKKKHGDDIQIGAVRLDSGDLAELSKKTRKILDDAGLEDIKIFLSSGLDEYEIHDLLEAGAQVDGFGVGTNMAVSPDATDLDMAYKLVDYGGEPKTKLSSDKVIYPGRKQVFRRMEGGRMVKDVIAAFDEEQPGEPLLVKVMEGGERVAGGREDLESTRNRALGQIEALPAELKQLAAPEEPYPVEISVKLKETLETLRRQRRPTSVAE
jgi:nicotinate phosphoribosyltransferase